jgi:predicted dehydrogenase
MTATRRTAPRQTAGRHGAIIGFGNVAARGHVPGWCGDPDFEIVAVADPDAARRALATELLSGVRTYASSDELLRHERLDFVDIAAPPCAHAPAILAAANAGVHVLCEKPLTTSWDEYVALREAARRAGIVLHTVHNWKYSEAFRVVRQLLADGAVGALSAISFDTARNGCAAATADNWRVRAAVAGGGILVDHGWHAFYLLLALAQERPLSIRAALDRRRYVDAEVEDTAFCAITFPSLTAEIRLTWAASERHTRWQLVGDDGEMTINDDQLVVHGRGAEQSRRLTTALSTGSHHPDWFSGVITEFRQALDDPTVHGANQAEAELCVRMLRLAYASGAQHSRVLDIPAPSAAVERGSQQP